MTEIIRVKILEDGITCREINKKEKPDRSQMGGLAYINKLSIWGKAESKLRTFKIAKYVFPLDEEPKRKCEYEVGSIHQAEVIDKETVRII